MRIPRGITLVELVVTVFIIGILAAIAYPSYQRHVLRTYRASAQACLQELAAYMERHYVERMSYANATLPNTACKEDLSQRYTFAFDGSPTATAFTIKAEAKGPQLRDEVDCHTLKIRSNGTRSPSNPDCWR